jgi:hypothetical protein
MRFKNYLEQPVEIDESGEMFNEVILLPKEIWPKKTVKAYKLFRNKNGKLYPLYVKSNDVLPIGKWIEAEEGDKNVKTGKVKSKLGDLAYRPGFHSGDMPIATHIGGKSQGTKQKKPDYRPDNQVWAEVLVPADVDWQAEANRRAKRTKKGKIIPRTAQIDDQIPKGGYYKYKTNANMTGSWLISGAVKILRVLSDKETEKINKKFGVADLPRYEILMKHSMDIKK